MLSIKVAIRFLRSSLGQTILIIIGISVGVSVQIFIGSLISGLQDDLVNTTIGNSSQVTISKEDSYISDYTDIITDLETDSNIKKITPTIKSSGNIIYLDNTSPVLFLGLNIEENNIYNFSEKIVIGTLPSREDEIIIGEALYTSLGLSVGDKITLSIPLVGDTDLYVVGAFDLGVSNLNSTYTVGSLSLAQSILSMSGEVSNIEMQVDDVFTAKDTAASLQSSLDNTYTVTNWEDLNGDLLSGLTAQSSSSLLIQVFVSISVVLAIASVLAISVVQKQKQIGILKAMGMSDKDTSKIFFSQGVILGLFGAIFGVILGVLLNMAFTSFALDPSGNPVINIIFQPTQTAIIAVVALASSAIASLIPARKSTKLSVIEVIKNG